MVNARTLVNEYYKQFGKTYAQMDCIKSIEKIITRYGGRSNLVGSNWWARHEIVNMRPLTNKSQLYDGCAVLKTKNPGEPGYALPARYAKDDDRIDYNHIGLGTNEGVILDSTRIQDSKGAYIRNGPGVSTSPIGPNSWDVIGDFEDVIYPTNDVPEVNTPIPSQRVSIVLTEEVASALVAAIKDAKRA